MDNEVIFQVDITKFSEVDNAIREIATNASMLKITDLESREQFDKVHDMRMKLVKMRTQGIDKIEADIKAPHLAFTKAIGAEAIKRREQLKEIEADLQVEEDKVNSHKEAIRMEKARKAQEKLNGRITALAELGGCVDITVVSALTDEEYSAELVRLAQVKKDKEDAEAREFLSQQEAMKKEREELDRQKAIVDKAQKDELERKQSVL